MMTRAARTRATLTERRKADLVRPAVAAYEAHVGDYGPDDRATMLCDMLADLMHYARRERVDFDTELDRARGHFEAEQRGEL